MRYPDLEISLLRAFVAVSESGGFTAASELVGRSQSAVSQKILRLEEIVGTRLFVRASRALNLTREGEELLVAARRILEINDTAVRNILEPKTVGALRLGVSEDFIPKQLPQMLSRFRRLYPGVHLELMTGLSAPLVSAFEAGLLDAVITKKDTTAQRGRVIWREPLEWMARLEYQPDYSLPVPLVLLPPPCSYRDIMLRTLDSVRREWFAACTASSLAGIQAAVSGGLGVTVLGRSFVGESLQVVRPPDHWPALPMSEIVIIGEETAQAELVRPLVSFLTETLSRPTAWS